MPMIRLFSSAKAASCLQRKTIELLIEQSKQVIAPNAREGTNWDVFCFLRDAETVGLGTRS
jgi:hypothetical protein